MAKPGTGGVLNTCQRCAATWRRAGSGRRRKLCDACLALRLLRSCGTCSASWSWLSRGPGPSYCSDACIPRCAVDGCRAPMKYRTDHGPLCPMHARRLRVHGDLGSAEPARDFSAPPDTCRQCGGPRGEGYAKWYCSVRCYGRYYGGVDEARVWACLECDAEMTSQTNRADATRCPRCSRVTPALSARQLAERDGTVCGLCGEQVDMALAGNRDRFGPAADHIVPRAKGGPNTAENLQLAHSRCNAVKRDELALSPEWVAALALEARASAAELDRTVIANACGAGHDRTPENGYWGRKGWTCRVCKVARQRDRRKAAEAVSAS